MRNTHQLITSISLGVIAPWGIVTTAITTFWPDKLPVLLIGAAICITVNVVIGRIAVGNRCYYDRHLDVLRIEVDRAIKAGKFGQVLDAAGAPYRPAVPDGPVTSVPVTGENAIVGMEEGAVVDLDAVRDAIRHSHN